MTVQEPDAALSARYGRTPGSARRTRWWLGGLAAFIVLVFVAWVIWGGQIFSPDASIDTEDVGFTVHDDTSITVRFQVTTNPGTATQCAVEALDEQYAVVGWKIVDVPASSQRTREFSEDLRTTGLADTGLISRCWAS